MEVIHKTTSYAILASGEFPARREIVSKLLGADIIICCDGAVSNLVKYGRNPDYIVGDLDSISPEDKLRFNAIIKHIPEQESNDLTKAFSLAAEMASREREDFTITIFGGTGKREDHTLGNISLLLEYARKCDVRMISDYGTFIPLFDTYTFKVRKGAPISIFSTDGTLNIISQGLMYKTDNVIFDSWWKATLNVADRESVTLRFNHPSKALLYIGFTDNKSDEI